MQRILILSTAFLSLFFAFIVLLEFGLERREVTVKSSQPAPSAEQTAKHIFNLFKAKDYEALWEWTSFESKLSFQIQLDALRRDNMNRSFLIELLKMGQESLDKATAREYYIRVAEFVERRFRKVMPDQPEGSTPFAGPMKSCKIQGRLATVTYQRPSGPDGFLYLVREPWGWRVITSGSVWAAD